MSENDRAPARPGRTRRAHPSVSVIIPTSNRSAALRRAVASVLAQTWADYELIVVDDGSREPIRPVVDAAADDRVQVLAHARCRGAAAARNAGIRASRGAFVAFLDDDDEWFPQKLERQLARFAAAPCATALVYGGAHVVSDQTGRIVLTRVPYPPAVGFVDLLNATVFGTSTPLIRRRCLDEVGRFDESLPGMQDRDLWLRIARCYPFQYVPEVLTVHHIHGDQISTNLDLKTLAMERMLAKYHDDLVKHPSLLAKQLKRMAMLYFASGNRVRGWRYLVRAVRGGLRWRELYPHLPLSLIAGRSHQRLVRRTAFRHIDGVVLFG